ncbi:leucyl aminopeptidase [Komagataeibacter rhaeticus]|uniref:Leucyl aminopeptidase n=1 Tax=Komagataeibacter rhaeticus TaxID=215221 RepID=A0A181C542_9PROT|nr:hypothetical protein [Komagataeibacter rhaeticus]ATU71729.1 leucyl aminopeptidase [Komagataeibacter xylinus]EGG77446.1 hypothetical protein SXCC_01835 [Gluconacetobacter sp. SXCC-1]KDU94680.1 leucyl aminopeptidase [Komagataeibacter rhaeticus AF1]MBL7239185.1 leucyl aminopeptidase [Komagataeibacter rhaeticus]PYD53803.1 leucyl aminopeptidase [Komagataeibacter rhaeticus]
MATDIELLELFREELKLCKVSTGQVLIVLSEGTTRADYARAFLGAATLLGAEAFQINLPPRTKMGIAGEVGRTPLAGNRPAIEALKAADIVIDLVGLLFSHEQNEITASGTRMLFVHEPFDVLKKMFPTQQLRQRVEYGEALLGRARTLRVTSPHGTDVRYEMGQYPVMTEYGFTDTPGRWDHFPSGFLLSQGNDGAVNGKVVLAPGDIVVALRRYVASPITLTIERGMVTHIAGDGLDAELFRGYIESYNDPRAYAVSHIGWGLNHLARWTHLSTTRQGDSEIGVNGLAYYGNVLFSLGPNTELGGTNDTACHMDIPMRGCSLYLDDTLIVENGVVVDPAMQPA